MIQYNGLWNYKTISIKILNTNPNQNQNSNHLNHTTTNPQYIRFQSSYQLYQQLSYLSLDWNHQRKRAAITLDIEPRTHENYQKETSTFVNLQIWSTCQFKSFCPECWSKNGLKSVPVLQLQQLEDFRCLNQSKKSGSNCQDGYSTLHWRVVQTHFQSFKPDPRQKLRYLISCISSLVQFKIQVTQAILNTQIF